MACLKYALDALHVAAPADSQLEKFIGPPLRESFAGLFGHGKEGLIDEAVALYRERFATQGIFESSVYPGVVETLAQLSRRRFWLSVATVKPRIFAEQILAHFGLGRFFNAVHGSELDGSNADKRDLLAYLLKSEALSPTDTIMIGDRSHDISAARANGIVPIGGLWGYGSREELVSAGAKFLCEKPEGILGLLATITPSVPVLARS